jgi:hypothetical protein
MEVCVSFYFYKELGFGGSIYICASSFVFFVFQINEGLIFFNHVFVYLKIAFLLYLHRWISFF